MKAIDLQQELFDLWIENKELKEEKIIIYEEDEALPVYEFKMMYDLSKLKPYRLEEKDEYKFMLDGLGYGVYLK